MIELRLKYMGEGRFQTATRHDLQVATDLCDTNEMLRARLTRFKSRKQNSYLHALVQAAYDNQQGGPVYAEWWQLRQWLLVHAGYFHEERYSVRGLPAEMVRPVISAWVASIRRRVDFVEGAFDPNSQEVVLRYPRRWRQADMEQSGEILTRVVDIICNEIVPGSDPISIMDHAKAMAA